VRKILGCKKRHVVAMVSLGWLIEIADAAVLRPRPSGLYGTILIPN
jgi:hypothetical protein